MHRSIPYAGAHRRERPGLLGPAGAVLLGLAAVAPPPLAAQVAEESAVADVVHAFHAALTSGDSATALAALHPDVVIYEGGHAETLDEYRSGHLRSDMAFAAATDRQIGDEAVTLWADAALYTATSRTAGTMGEREIDARGTETVVLVRTPAGWRIRHIHWSSRRGAAG